MKPGKILDRESTSEQKILSPSSAITFGTRLKKDPRHITVLSSNNNSDAEILVRIVPNSRNLENNCADSDNYNDDSNSSCYTERYVTHQSSFSDFFPAFHGRPRNTLENE